MLRICAVFLCLAPLCGCDRNPGEAQGPAPVPRTFSLVSPDFKDGGRLSPVFTCDGENVPPRLDWSGAPEGAESFALVLEDPDAPGGSFTHWSVVDIPAGTASLGGRSKMPPSARELKNGFGGLGYGGPCPPSGVHRYIFTLYALPSARLEGYGNSVPGSALAKTSITALYSRKRR